MAFITKANSKRILRKIRLSDIPDIKGDIYKKPIYFLSKWETKYLLLMKSLLMEPEKFAIEVYQPIFNKDTFQYIFESEQSPSYHENVNCERLNSKFTNFEIPFEVKANVRDKAVIQGKSESEIEILEKLEVENFRKWFKEHFDLFNTDTNLFLKKLEQRWFIQIRINEIEKDNSGSETIDNMNLEELEIEIDKIIREAGNFYTTNKDKQDVIKKFQKLTFLAYRKDCIENNDTELSDKQLKDFLLTYDTKFKKPIKELLIQYYRVKYNPELSFEGQLLERLNFKPCSVCYETSDKKIKNNFFNPNIEFEPDINPF